MSTNMRGREPRTCRVEFRLNRREMQLLEDLAFQQDCPISQVVRKALAHYTEGCIHRGEFTNAKKRGRED